jgi:hypothetical protein
MKEEDFAEQATHPVLLALTSKIREENNFSFTGEWSLVK